MMFLSQVALLRAAFYLFRKEGNLSSRSSRNALFIGKHKDPQFKRGKPIISPTELMALERVFNTWKKKPWSPEREKMLGNLSMQIHRAKHHLRGISYSSSLKKFGSR